MDFYDNPGFVHDLFSAIADYNIAQVNEALKYDIDAVYFGPSISETTGDSSMV
jgi:uroporphyrinogen decarboxylase